MDISAAFNSIKPLHPHLELILSSPPRIITAPGDKYEQIKGDPRQNNNNDSRSRGREDLGHDFRDLIAPSATKSATQYIEAQKGASKVDDVLHHLPRISKFPDDASKELLSEAGSHNYLYSARGYGEKVRDTSIFRTAAMNYAQNFFSDTGTFARAGESLELTA